MIFGHNPHKKNRQFWPFIATPTPPRLSHTKYLTLVASPEKYINIITGRGKSNIRFNTVEHEHFWGITKNTAYIDLETRDIK